MRFYIRPQLNFLYEVFILYDLKKVICITIPQLQMGGGYKTGFWRNWGCNNIWPILGRGLQSHFMEQNFGGSPIKYVLREDSLVRKTHILWDCYYWLFSRGQFFSGVTVFGPRFCVFLVRISNARHWKIGLCKTPTSQNVFSRHNLSQKR